MLFKSMHNKDETMKLVDLISWLSKQNQTRKVASGFASAHIGRGPSAALVFTPRECARIGDMLSYAQHAMHSSLRNCDGEFVSISPEISVHIGHRGQSTQPITDDLLLRWSVACACDLTNQALEKVIR